MEENKARQETIDSFLAYLKENPTERFWQALAHWSESSTIYRGGLSKKGELGATHAVIDGMKVFLQDTYYLTGKDK